MNDTAQRRYEANFTAGRYAREGVDLARQAMAWSRQEASRGNLGRADSLKHEAKCEREVARSIVAMYRGRPGFVDGYADNGATAPQLAAERVADGLAPTTAPNPGPCADSDASARRAANIGDMKARGGYAPHDPENRP